MVHTRLSHKSEFNNFSQSLEPSKKDNVPTCWDSERACMPTGQSRRMRKMELPKKSLELPMYDPGGCMIMRYLRDWISIIIFLKNLYCPYQFSCWRRWSVLKWFTHKINKDIFSIICYIFESWGFSWQSGVFWRADLGLCQKSHWQPWQGFHNMVKYPILG